MVMVEPRFDGFPVAARTMPIPAALLHELIPRMTDPAELIVTLYGLAALQRVRRFPRLIALADLRVERPLVEALTALSPDRSFDQALADGLSAAVARGTLLRSTDDWLALNSADGRRAMASRPARAARSTPPPSPRGEGIVGRYEDVIGPLPPVLADELHTAAVSYPEQWIVDAFNEAAALNKRSWRYVRRILERWASEGRDDAPSVRPDRPTRKSRYDHIIQH